MNLGPLSQSGPDAVLACSHVRVWCRPLLRFLEVGGFGMALLALLLTPIFGLASPLTALLVAIMPAVLAYSQRHRPGGEVHLKETGVHLRTAQLHRYIRRRDVEGGYVQPRTNAVVLRLTSGERVVVDLTREGAPLRILEHLVGVEKQALTAPLRGVLGAFTKGLLAFVASMLMGGIMLAALVGGRGVLLAFLLACAFTTLIVARFGRPLVVVGADGIRLTGGLWTRFIPFDEITGVHALTTPGLPPGRRFAKIPSPPGGDGVHLDLRGGGSLRLPTIGQSAVEVEALAQRIEAGIRAYAPLPGDRLLGLLERQGRSVAAWKEALRRMALAGRGFRDQALGREDFERVLADASARADRRIGAALALRAIDEAAVKRIRVAAAASANAELRVALEAASGDEVDEEALEEAMAKQAKA